MAKGTNVPAVAGETLAKSALHALEGLAKRDKAAAVIVGSYLKALREQNISALDDGEVFAMRTPSGVVKAFRTSALLSVDNKGLVDIPAVGLSRSAKGYQMLANAAGLTVVNAATVTVNGVQQKNPHIEYDAAGKIKAVYARALCYGYTQMGVPVVSDRTCVFDVDTYRVVDLLGKAKKDSGNFRLMPKGEKPESDGVERWAVYPIDEVSDIAVNLASEQAAGWFAQILNRIRKAPEFAQTFAQRNAVKHHPAIPGEAVDVRGRSEQAQLVCWRPVAGELDRSHWEESRYEAFRAGLTEPEKLAATEVVEGTDDMAEQAQEAEAAAVDVDETVIDEHEKPEAEEGAHEGLFGAPFKPEKLRDEGEVDEDLKTILSQVRAVARRKPAKFAKVLEELGLSEGDFVVTSDVVDAPLCQHVLKLMGG